MSVQFGAIEIPIGVPAADQTLNILAKIDERAQLVGQHATSSLGRLNVPRTAVASMETAGEGALDLTSRLEHLGVAGSFAITNLANGSEMGLTRVAHTLALFGGSFGPVGLLVTTFVAVAGEQLIQWFRKAGDEADKAREKFESDIGGMANAAQATQLRTAAKNLLYGTPFDEKGHFIESSTRVAGAFKGSLADMEAEFAELSKQIPKDAAMVSGAVGQRYNELVPKLNAARKAFEDLQRAANNLANQPAGTAGQFLPMTSSARSDDKIARDEKKSLDDRLEANRKHSEFLTKILAASKSVAEDITRKDNEKQKADEDTFYKMMDEGLRQDNERKRKLREADLEHQRMVNEQARQLAHDTATIIGDTMKGLWSGGVSGGLRALGDGLLKTLGDIFIQIGEKMLAAAPIFQAISTALLALDGAGLALGGVALIALGAAMGAAAGGGSGHRGGGSGGGYSPNQYGANITATLSPTYTPNTQGVTAKQPVTHNWTVIGKNDPTAQRDILELIARAERRGSTSG